MTDTIKKAAKPRGSTLDRAMAGFMAAAVAFVAVAMPDEFIPFAPAGSVTRVAVAALGGIVTYFLVAALLSVLGKPRSRKSKKAVEVANEPPRLRRADAHPDAPSRSPILAGRELGLPLDEVAIEERPAADLTEVENVDFEAEWERPLPELINEQALAAEPEPVEWEPVENVQVPPSPSVEAAEVAPDIESASEAPASDIPFWVPPGSTAPAEPLRETEPEPVVAEQQEPQPPLAVPFPKPRTKPAASDPLNRLIERLPEGSDSGAPVEGLVDRLETGLARRNRPSARTAEGELDQRLRSALGDLKKMSGRR
jgi:hypothetical protein